MSSIFNVFQNHYSKLMRALPMNDEYFLAELYTNKLLPGDLKSEIESLPTAAKRASKFLDDVIKPSVEDDDSGKLRTVLSLMNDFNVKELTDKIIILLDKIENIPNLTLPSNKQGNMNCSSNTTNTIQSTYSVTKPLVFDTVHDNLCGTYKETRYKSKGTEWPPHQPKSIVSVALIHYKGKRTRQELFAIAQRHKDGSIGIDELLSSSSQAPAAKKQCLDHSRITKTIADIFIADPMDQTEKPVVFDILHDNLCDRYTETRYVSEETEWPPHQPKSIVSVALIHYKGKRTRQELFAIAQRHKDGSIGIDELLSSSSQAPALAAKKQCLDHSRITKDIADIFIADPMDQTESNTESSKPPRRILIEGAPGIGKTVLAKEIAYCWANKEVLPDVELLLLIYLRDPRLREIKEIKELLQLFTSPKIAVDVADYLQECNGNSMAFVIDGFDEYPTSLQKSSFIVDIIKGRILHKAIVVVTSRPTATVFLHDQVDRRIDILGFAKEEREKYITESLGDCSEKKIELFKYLKRQPTINAFCYIPLHLAVLLYLFNQGGVLPETLTEMNESFIIRTVYRYLAKHEQPSLFIISKLSDLPKPILSVVYKISQLAYKGLQENQLVFTLNEITQTCPDISKTPGAINGYGLLQAVQCFPQKGAGVTASLNFLHYTMQEYLAAFYVSTLSDEQQTSQMETTFWNEHFSFMWMMYVGIVGTKSKLFIDFISKGNVYKKKSGIKVSNEIQRDKRKRLHVFQCYTEANSKTEVPDIIASMFKDGIVKITDITLLPNHISSLVSFLSYSLINLKVLQIRKCNFGDIGMNILAQYIADNKEKISLLGYIDLMENNSSPWSLYCTIIKQCNVSNLTLCGDHGMEEFTHNIEDSLLTNTTLHSLTLCEIGITALNIIKAIVFYNESSFHLNEVNLSSRNVSVKATSNSNVFLQLKCLISNKIIGSRINRVVSVDVICNENNSLATYSLNLSYQCEGNDVFFVAFCLCYNTKIYILNISNNSINDLGAQEIAKALHQNKTLQQLNISHNNIHVDGAKAIAQALLENRTLLKLDISNNNICFDGTKGISECIKKNLILQELIISNNALFKEGAKLMAEMIEINAILQKLDISSNKISDEGVIFISGSLKLNSGLQELNLSKNEITNKGLEKLSEAIKMNMALVKLDLSKNFVTTEGVVDFLKTVSNKSVLQSLNFAYNNITKYGLSKHGQYIKVFSFSLKVFISYNIIADEDANTIKSYLFCYSHNNTTTSSEIEVDTWPLHSISNVEHRAAFLSKCLKEDDPLQSFKLHDKGILNHQSSFMLIAEAIQTSTAMQRLDLSNNSISDDGVATIINSLKMNTSLQELNLKHNKITDRGIHLISEAIKMTRTLQKIYLCANEISDDGVAAISDSLKLNRSLVELDIGDNNITDKGAKLIFEAIQVNTTVQKLMLDHNKISNDGAAAISDCLKINNSLQELNLAYNNITEKGAKLIFEAIRIKTTMIQKLVLEGNKISDDGVAAISDSLKINRSLQELYLGHSNITNQGTRLIFEAIGVNTVIQILVLNDNKISDDEAAAISDSLKMNRSLKELDIGYNRITGKGAKLIFEAIQVNITLKKLILEGNRISDSGATAISDSLKVNGSLQELNIGFTSITDKGTKRIFEAIQGSTTIKKLELHHNQITDDGAAAISDSLKINKSLQELNIGINIITNKGAKLIFEAVKVNATIQKLELSNNQISNSQVAAIYDSLEMNRSLQELRRYGTY